MKRAVLLLVFCAACGGETVERTVPLARVADVVLSELSPANPGGGRGAARDEHGDYDDWIELYNPSERDVDLAGLEVSDLNENPTRYRLPMDPPTILKANSYLLLFADGETHQGTVHLPFALSKDGEDFSVRTSTGAPIAAIAFPEMEDGQSYALTDGAMKLCETPTPGAANLCTTREVPPKTEYEPYLFADPFPALPAGPVVIAEVDPFGATSSTSVPWIELLNLSDAPVDLATVALYQTSIVAPAPIPITPQGVRVPLTGTLAAGASRVVEVLELSPVSEVILIFGPGDEVWDRFAYEDAERDTIFVLPADRGLRVSCDLVSATPGEENVACAPPQVRPVPAKWLRSMPSLADFNAMAGPLDETSSDAASVKFIIDRQNANTIYFVDSKSWALHFEWVWEVIEKNPPFDLCDPAQKQEHAQEWGDFSVANYSAVDARRYYLGTLIHYRNSDLFTIEFAAGDLIPARMVEETFFIVASNIYNGTDLYYRPTTQRLNTGALDIEGNLPIVATDVPFAGQTLQTLNPAVGYGVLEFVRAVDIETAPITYQSIVVLDRIPNELPAVGGTITEEFQTPLAHVNVLAQNRGTPNMALKNASTDPRITPFFGQLVRFEVGIAGFTLRTASSTEAEEFWRLRREERPILEPPLDLGPRALIDLSTAGFDDVKSIGAKAAQYGEILNLNWQANTQQIGGPCAFSAVAPKLPVPSPAFAIPFSRYVEHLQRAGIDQQLAAFLADPTLASDPVRRRAELLRIRELIEDAPIDAELLNEVTSLVQSAYGNQRVRFRSSTNVEDLAGFNGAGLYESHSGQLNSEVRPIEKAIKQTWSSLWTFRGYEERALFGVDQNKAAMAVLINFGTPDEEVNGVAITRNVVSFDPGAHGFYINAQIGELSVVLPETGDLPEQLIYKLFDVPDVVVLGRSTATGGAPVLELRETHKLACALTAIHNHFIQHYRTRIDTSKFAVDVEWKLVGAERELRIKQARPWISGAAVQPTTCP